MHIHFVIHETYEGPGSIESWCIARKHHRTRSNSSLFDALPSNVQHIDMLVVMGGPQSTVTTREDCQHFDAVAEKRLINKCILAGKLVVGFCLGAQLIGEVLGATTEPSPNAEYGWFPISLIGAAQEMSEFAGFPARTDMFHWHAQMPGLTPRAQVLASSQGCPRQIIKYTDKVFGFQCHPEFTKEGLDALLAHSKALLDADSGSLIQNHVSMRGGGFNRINLLLWSFLDSLTVS